MRRWQRWGLAVGVCGALLGGGTATAVARDGDDHPKEVRFRLYAVTDPAADVFVPVDPAAAPPDEEGAPAPGDAFIFRDLLFELDESSPTPTPSGDQVGTNRGMCTVTDVLVDELDAGLMCHGVVTLDRRGDITWHGVGRFSDLTTDGIRLALTGGTGEFADAGGDVTVLEVGASGGDGNVETTTTTGTTGTTMADGAGTTGTTTADGTDDGTDGGSEEEEEEAPPAVYDVRLLHLAGHDGDHS